ncbi:hypothetical protein C5167_027051 [Papaver somniferum]|uniref:uncharacterized protein LOC113336162 n=1 Tax=Papaver somniferum TaxID=3469 RepID=UPI000E6F9777|nr:uncharacterized protein LOC113336162 [Papaver somniferum]RZC89513.1 hypothetical protein C5167_027051 [Papaver somniferum]
MARANMMGWAMLVVVVMALYVGKAEAWPCAYDCAVEHAEEHGGSWSDYIVQCVGECREHSPPRLLSSIDEVKASPQLAKALELLAQAPELQHEFMRFQLKSMWRVPHSKKPMKERLP